MKFRFGVALIASSLFLFFFVQITVSQNAEIDLLNANFETLRMYSLLVNSSLTFECIWYLSPLFGENALFSPLPSTTTEFSTRMNFNMGQTSVVEDELVQFYQNSEEEDQLSIALYRCGMYGDNNTAVLLYLYNLLRSYEKQTTIICSSQTDVSSGISESSINCKKYEFFFVIFILYTFCNVVKHWFSSSFLSVFFFTFLSVDYNFL